MKCLPVDGHQRKRENWFKWLGVGELVIKWKTVWKGSRQNSQ